MLLLPNARVLKDRRTKKLVARLQPGDVAFIHHSDLDATAALALAECRVAAVVNAVPSISGRYPNRGPLLLLKAGIPLIDAVGEEAFEKSPSETRALVEEGTLKLTNGFCLTGRLLTTEMVLQQMEEARANLNHELDLFARNTLEYLNNERDLLFDPIEAPHLRTRFEGRQTLIVVRGEGYKQDLARLSEYLHDVRPVLLAVDGGADALLEAKLSPDIILGDMDSISDRALKCGAELIVHGYASGDARGAPGLKRLEALGLKAEVFRSAGTSEDAAMLLADALGATLLVAVGTHFSLEEFLDKGRGGMASTFLTRLRIGSKLVDAKGIGKLWETKQHPRIRDVALIFFAAATPVIAMLYLSDYGRAILRYIAVLWRLHVH